MLSMFVVQLGCTDLPLSDGAVLQPGAPVLEPYLPPPERLTSVPVFGGTLESVPALGGVVAADPEGNRLLWVLGDEVVAIDLGDNARPFRVHVEDSSAWVTLRGTGELAEIALDTATVDWRTRVRLEPRGVTRSPNGRLVVVCAGGEVVELDDDGHLVRLAVLDSDLRDVVEAAEGLLVSRFATAEVLAVDPTTLAVTARTVLGTNGGVAWRMRPYDGGALVLHQAATRSVIRLSNQSGDFAEDSAAYGANDFGCSGTMVDTVLTETSADTVVRQSATLKGVTVGTDFVVARDGTVAVASAGAATDAPEVFLYEPRDGGIVGCSLPVGDRDLAIEGRASSVAIDEDGRLVMQAAAPFTLVRDDGAVVVTEPPDATTGIVQLFHTDPGVGLSCASCHPEGLDDGHVWTFFVDPSKPFPRRTMPLAGQLLSRMPYHWDAALEDPDALMGDTFVSRMGGTIDPGTTAALFDWLDGMRHLRAHPVAPESAVAAGRVAFSRAGCDACHEGSAFTSNAIASVGGTEPVKVPSLLGVGVRNHLLHDGSLHDLDARFELAPADEPRGSDTHGDLTVLGPEELEALKAYLRTL